MYENTTSVISTDISLSAHDINSPSRYSPPEKRHNDILSVLNQLLQRGPEVLATNMACQTLLPI